MPEIKHQFTGGKMNKDLDERLVPNGEYRDAMNIQVSTSEDSEVGTVQNILGNSLVSGQRFIGENAVCVGSIADEKNDKLYYFITQKELLSNGNFDNNGEGWNVSTQEGYTGSQWSFSGDQAIGTTGDHGTMFAPALGVVEGNTYRITYDVILGSTGSLVLANHTTSNGNISFIGENTPGTYSVDWLQGASSSRQNNIWIWNSDPYDGVIDNISVREIGDFIVEYDSKTNSITPVLVDTIGDVLKFDPDNIITGINIIDDLLFWTDNENEPKKINIQRSIKGTDPSGTVHTNFINDKRTDPFGQIKEEHITVIRKAPKAAPTIELISERGIDNEKIYTGVMRITSPPSPPTEKGGIPGTGMPGTSNYQNTSSMNLGDLEGYSPTDGPFKDFTRLNHLYDFSTLKVGSYFDTQIETNIYGDSGFVLDWEKNDVVLFKEFGGNEYDEVPKLPIVDYVIKARITDWSYNEYTDEPLEQLSNGSFGIPNYNGTMPEGWNITADNASNYSYERVYYSDGESLAISCNQPAESNLYDKIYTGSWGVPSHSWVVDATYRLSFEIKNYTSGKISCQMVISDDLFVAAGLSTGHPSGISTNNTWSFKGPGNSTSNGYYQGDGIHTHEFTANPTDSSDDQNSWGNYKEKIMFQVRPDGFVGDIINVSCERLDAPSARVRCKVLSINQPPVAPVHIGELRFAVDKVDEQEKLFEFKFPRFAYRYQYEDREYSTMSPFSPIAFIPGPFDYHPKKGYNLGMVNRINKIGIKNFTTNVPDGVVAIDILYKDDSSPNVYVVDTIKPKHSALGGGKNMWDDNELIITSEQISQMLPSNQLLRLWDAVPKKALAQDISGNRIIYGNYTQGFDLKAGDVSNTGEEYYPDFSFNITSDSNDYLSPKKSVKSLREYQLGVVFVDEYGRETPVISNKSGTKKINKLESSKANKIQISFNSIKYPENMKYFKFFIKETSGEYYNLAMDRYYDAEDGHVWISFPSTDRNKVDIDTFLILKKGLESDLMVKEEAKYKILDIKNEAPDFIKRDRQLVEQRTHVADTAATTNTDIFGAGLVDAPLIGNNSFKMNYDQFQASTGSNLHEIDKATKDVDLYFEFTNSSNEISKRYRASKITTNYVPGGTGVNNASEAQFSITLDKPLGDDINFITDDASGLSPTKIKNGTIVNIYEYTKENSPRFDGRFFVKIDTDAVFNENFLATTEELDVRYRTILNKKLYYLSRYQVELHRSELTGQFHGEYDDANYDTDTGGFGSYAPFFRNYNTPANDINDMYLSSDFSGYSDNPDVGQYVFGNSDDWRKELAWVTTYAFERSGSNNTGNNWGALGNNGIKVADSSGRSENRYGTFEYEALEQTAGDVWFIDGGWSVGNKWDDGLTYDTHASNNISEALGIDEESWWGKINIGLGGIYHDESLWGITPGHILEFFNIGNAQGNPNYTSGGFATLISKFYTGQKFRWREDPNNEIYTILPSTGGDVYQKLRYDIGMDNWQSVTTQSQFPNNSGYNGTDNEPDSNFSGSHEVNFTPFTPQLSPNFTKNWEPRFQNSNGEGFMDWNPIGNGTPKPIVGGLKLSIDHHITEVWGGTGEPYVVVNDLTAIGEPGSPGAGLEHSITTGMILTKHSDGGTAYDASTEGQEPLAIKSITDTSGTGIGPYRLYLSGYNKFLTDDDAVLGSGVALHDIYKSTPIRPTVGKTMIFEQPRMNGYSQYSVNRINAQHNGDSVGGIMAIGYNLEFIEPIEAEPLMPENPAIWETEPKESTDLDIYYEASGLNPLKLGLDTATTVIPIGSTVEHVGFSGSITDGTTIIGVSYHDAAGANAVGTHGFYITTANKNAGEEPLVGGVEYIGPGEFLKITKPNGNIVEVEVIGYWGADLSNNRTNTIYISPNLYGPNTSYTLNWHNCYSFGNGVESNRIRDNFNLPFISNGVKVSTTLDEGLGEEHRKYGLTYSGIYNSNSSTNNLNQFIAAEKITKDINPIHGSIQKLHARDSDLVTLCEDKCLRILVQKDALFNADGDAQLLAREGVLGQTISFSGEFGISKNPESFASESYRVYFTDKQRGAVMRLSKDGLTPISMHGMKDWFKDNLKLSTKLIGSHDDKKDEYNITLADRKTLGDELIQDPKITDNTIWSVDGGNVADFSGIGALVTSPGTGSGNSFPQFYNPNVDLVDGKTYQVTVKFSQISQGGEVGGAIKAFIYGPPNAGGVSNYRPYYDQNVTNGISVSTFVFDQSQNNDIPTMRFSVELTEGDDYVKTVRVEFVSLKAVTVNPITVSFREDVRGWVSFKSFVLENGVSMANDYYTMLGGRLYKHHIESVDRNNFYGIDYNSSINVILNDGPGSVKSFHTLNYEGSQSKIDVFSTDTITGLSDAQPYNLTSQDGWYISGIETDKQVGSLNEFIEKEGKWFNYIKGVDSDITSETDFGAFDIQGIGILSKIDSDTLTFDNNINTSLQVDDVIYFQTPSINGMFDTIDSDNITKYGDVTALTSKTITVNLTGSTPVKDDYIMFAKNHTINTSSLLGYFADVKFENNSIDKIELFSVGSEISESSK